MFLTCSSGEERCLRRVGAGSIRVLRGQRRRVGVLDHDLSQHQRLLLLFLRLEAVGLHFKLLSGSLVIALRAEYWREFVESHEQWRQTPWMGEGVGGPRYPASVCGVPCTAGKIRRYQVDKCCWVCESCPFPQVRHNVSSCIPCQLNPGKRVQEPNSFRNACVDVQPQTVGVGDMGVLAVLIAAGVGLVLTLLTALLFLTYSSTPIIKAAGRELSSVLLAGISLCYLCVFLLAPSPSAATCGFIRFCYSLSYTISYAAIFVKINRIARIFHVSKTGAPQKRTRYTSPVSQLVAVGSIIFFQASLNGVWLIIKPPTRDTKVCPIRYRCSFKQGKVSI